MTDGQTWYWTIDGAPAGFVFGQDVYSESSRHVGRIVDGIIYRPAGSYLGEFAEDRVVRRRDRLELSIDPFVEGVGPRSTPPPGRVRVQLPSRGFEALDGLAW